MTVHYFTPFSVIKNLGISYNQAMGMMPDGDTGCLVDGDTCFLTPDWGNIIHEYANAHPNAVLTCYLNRIHPLATGQLHPTCNSDDVRECMKLAESIKHIRTATPITGSVSGTLMLIPKHIWAAHPFAETNTFRPNEPNLLGCDNEWTNRIRRNGVQILRMNGLILYHQYRLMSNGKDKSHLL